MVAQYLARFACRRRQIKKKPKSRINWLRRQLSQTRASDIFVRASWSGRAKDTQASLESLRESADVLLADNATLVPKYFDIILVRDLAGKFAGPRTFIESLESIVPEYYEQVGQHLRAWVPPPPKPVEENAKQSQKAMPADGDLDPSATMYSKPDFTKSSAISGDRDT